MEMPEGNPGWAGSITEQILALYGVSAVHTAPKSGRIDIEMEITTTERNRDLAALTVWQTSETLARATYIARDA